jgi:cupin fold WbuC family metalloprotein
MKEINQTGFSDLLNKANISPRKRTHYNLHKDLSDPIQRLFVAIEPGSYIRPHRHPEPNKWECFLIFKGSAVMLEFSEDGKVAQKTELKYGGSTVGAEIPPGVWHTLAATGPGTILMELKPGPYGPLSEKDYPYWAPAENSEKSAQFEEWLRIADIGSVYPDKNKKD